MTHRESYVKVTVTNSRVKSVPENIPKETCKCNLLAVHVLSVRYFLSQLGKVRV